jgi:hypothetical protein
MARFVSWVIAVVVVALGAVVAKAVAYFFVRGAGLSTQWETAIVLAVAVVMAGATYYAGAQSPQPQRVPAVAGGGLPPPPPEPPPPPPPSETEMLLLGLAIGATGLFVAMLLAENLRVVGLKLALRLVALLAGTVVSVLLWRRYPKEYQTVNAKLLCWFTVSGGLYGLTAFAD